VSELLPPGLLELGREVEELRAAVEGRPPATLASRHASSRMREVAALYTFADKLAYADSLEEVYAAALDAIIAALACDRASILTFDQHKVMRFVAWRGLSDRYRQAVDGHTPWLADTQHPQPIALKDILDSFESDEIKRTVATEGIRGLAFIPLIANGRLIGKFMTYYNAPHEFEKEEIKLASTIASQIALGIERKRAQEAEKMLIGELQHRTNNLLTVVQAIAHQSLRGSGSLDELRTVFEGRLQAVARANRELASSRWGGVNLTELIRRELEPFAAHVELQGEKDVFLSSQQAQNFSLAIHELATNAAKYGPFSSVESRGSVRVSWEIDHAKNEIKFRWEELGGPPVMLPEKKGFGTSLINSMFHNAAFSYRPAGLVCELSAPLGTGPHGS
jgi:two-component sensor histidine kinase